MKTPLSFMRIFYTILSVILLTTYAITTNLGQSTLLNIFVGTFLGLLISGLMIGADYLLKRVDFRSLTITLIGLVFGFMIGQVFLMILTNVLDASLFDLSQTSALFLKIALFLTCAYLGMLITLRTSEQTLLNLPFLKNQSGKGAGIKRELILDSSILADSRLIDIASSGLLDQQAVIPRFVLNDLYNLADSPDEQAKARAKRSLDTYKKLETLPNLELRIMEIDFPEIRDVQGKLIRLAREQDSAIFTADVSRVQQLAIDGVKFININALSNALKPITQTGEILLIKIQRYGKEPRQGVGYLEDGTMVVVNSGAEYIGETIRAQVLSVKHTASGRMIFCNAADEGITQFDGEHTSAMADLERKHKEYMSL